MSYSRYKSFTGDDGSVKTVPFIPIREQSTDKYTYWKQGFSRMDLLSFRYYQDANYGWFIMQANPHLPSLEFMIDNNEKIRIPFPLESAIAQYENDIKVYNEVEGGK